MLGGVVIADTISQVYGEKGVEHWPPAQFYQGLKITGKWGVNWCASLWRGCLWIMQKGGTFSAVWLSPSPLCFNEQRLWVPPVPQTNSLLAFCPAGQFFGYVFIYLWHPCKGLPNPAQLLSFLYWRVEISIISSYSCGFVFFSFWFLPYLFWSSVISYECSWGDDVFMMKGPFIIMKCPSLHLVIFFSGSLPGLLLMKILQFNFPFPSFSSSLLLPSLPSFFLPDIQFDKVVDWRICSGDSSFDAWIDLHGHHLFNSLGRTVHISESLWDPHLETIRCLRTFTAVFFLWWLSLKWFSLWSSFSFAPLIRSARTFSRAFTLRLVE